MISCNQESPTSTNTTHPGGQQEQVRGNPRRVEDGPTLQQTRAPYLLQQLRGSRYPRRSSPRRASLVVTATAPIVPPAIGSSSRRGRSNHYRKRTGGQPGSAGPPPDLTRGWWAATPPRRVLRVAGRQRSLLRTAGGATVARSPPHQRGTHRTSTAVWACASGVPRRRHASRAPRSASIVSAPTDGLRCQPCRGRPVAARETPGRGWHTATVTEAVVWVSRRHGYRSRHSSDRRWRDPDVRRARHGGRSRYAGGRLGSDAHRRGRARAVLRVLEPGPDAPRRGATLGLRRRHPADANNVSPVVHIHAGPRPAACRRSASPRSRHCASRW